MTRSDAEGKQSLAHRVWKPGVRTGLVLAFVAVATFVILAAAAGLFAFRQVGGRLDVVDSRVPPTLAALELSRSAERIIAVAPALVAAGDRNRRDEIKAELAAEIERLNGRLAALNTGEAGALPLDDLEPIVSSLTASLVALEALVARRLETSDRLGTLRRGFLQANDGTQLLLAPWLEITDSEIAALVETGDAVPAASGKPRLASLIALQQLMRSAQALVSRVADMLAEASTSDQPGRLPILAFQLGLALDELERKAAGLDSRLSPLFLEQVAKLRAFAEGPDAIAEARGRELALLEDGEELLAETGRLSARLTVAVDRLGDAARRDVAAAIGDALAVQRLSTRALVVIVALSLMTSVLIVWRYVGGNIVRRLSALGDDMLAIASGRLHTPVAIEGGDEIAALGRAVEVFRRNTLERDGLLAERAQAADVLERQVRQRTAELARSIAEVEEKSRQLEAAGQYKSRFLASASHDLRQPLHALNLLVGQLRTEAGARERTRLVARIDAAVGSMNELFDALLDMSKLDAGLLEPKLAEFPIQPLLGRIETTFAEAAREKGLRLAVLPSSAWIRSDFILLERILLNLTANAVRYTVHGGVVVGCRRRGDRLRIDVCDSGSGIPQEQQRNIFGEFVQLASIEAERSGGLGLGLSIVERLGRLLDHPVEVSSSLGRGSRFSIAVPSAAARGEAAQAPLPPAPIADPAPGKCILVIDDDALALDGLSGILRSWGCEVISARSGEGAVRKLAARRLEPDLVISDYRLGDGMTGIDAIERIRSELGIAAPAFLISGDTAPELLRKTSASGYLLLHKPVAPMRLRAILNQLLKARGVTRAAE